jgi:hypothetical protein
MRILIVNPSHLAIGSRVPREQLPPLGLQASGIGDTLYASLAYNPLGEVH